MEFAEPFPLFAVSEIRNHEVHDWNGHLKPTVIGLAQWQDRLSELVDRILDPRIDGSRMV